MDDTTAELAPPVTPTAPAPTIRLVKIPGGVPDLDADLFEKVAAQPGDIIRIRIPLQMYVAVSKNAPGLKNNTWILEFQTAAQVAEFRNFLGKEIEEYVEARR